MIGGMAEMSWLCDSCSEPVVTADGDYTMLLGTNYEYMYHDYCWEVEKKAMIWFEDANGELREGEPDGEDKYCGGGDDPVFRQQMQDAGRGALLR